MREQEALDPIESYALIHQARRELLFRESRCIIQGTRHRRVDRAVEKRGLFIEGATDSTAICRERVADRLDYLSTRGL